MRKAFIMSVHAGAESAYEERHNPIWPDLEETLRAHGVHNYSIFLLEETCQLFAYVEIESEERWAAIGSAPQCQRWWHHMRDLMPHRDDNSPVTKDMREVFHLD